MNKAIVHMDLDTFFVSCERLADSSLNGIPLIIGGSKERGVVSCASIEARKFGVRSGMPQFMVNKLCPQAKVIKGDFDLYARCSETVTEIIQESAPLMEKSSIDEFYLDISGMDKYFGCLKWTTELRDRIVKHSGLPISFGLSINKTVSKMATNEGKPYGKLMISEPDVPYFMNPLPVIKLPGIGNSTFQVLSRIGIRKIGTLAEIPTDVMGKLLGKNGISISQKSKGIDHTPVKPYSKRKSISKERTFNADTMNKVMLHTLLTHMIEELCFQLRKDNWLTSCISVKIKYNNFDTHTKQKNIAFTACDQTLRNYAFELLDKVYERRMRLRLIGVSFNKLVRGKYQINLFDDSVEKIQLYQAMDKIKSRFHPGVVQWGAGFRNKTSANVS
ncbi:DNA polymerase IV [Portibacter marinus]|uniref:DNA polymerase IV n=1 Tax=Portibacter marinus TaxID=2898660 RepID=UPI001F20FCE0|nr:DNA polymerase IV [Portibacter marinus]